MQITISEFAAWKHHPVTVEFMQYLKDVRLSLQDDLVEGHFTRGSTDETAQLTADAIGRCKLLRDLSAIEYTDILKFYDIDIEEGNNDGGIGQE